MLQQFKVVFHCPAKKLSVKNYYFLFKHVSAVCNIHDKKGQFNSLLLHKMTAKAIGMGLVLTPLNKQTSF